MTHQRRPLWKGQYEIRPISYAEAMDVVVREHYLHRKCASSKAFGLFLGDEIKGVICYGTPSSAPLRKTLAGPENALNVCELMRLWVADSVPRNGESYLIGNTLKDCGKEIVVSYAEVAQGHLGVVYQATNWIYTGLSARRRQFKIEGVSTHCQRLADVNSAAELRAKYGDKFGYEWRPPKHRYVWINAKGKRRAELLAKLAYPAQPYPKAEKPAVPAEWRSEPAMTCFSKCYNGEGSYYCPVCEYNQGSVWLDSDWRPTKWQALCPRCRLTFRDGATG